jgi:hypothetical protein
MLNRKIHAPLERGTPWTSRMTSSNEKADGMYEKKVSLNLMEFRYYGRSNDSTYSVVDHYHFASGFHHSYR